jgi:hypothetical protein
MDQQRAESLAAEWLKRVDRPSAPNRLAGYPAEAAHLEVCRALRWLVPDEVADAAVVDSQTRRGVVVVLADRTLMIVDGEAENERSGQATIVVVPVDSSELAISVVSRMQDDPEGARGDFVWTVRRGHPPLFEARTGWDSRQQPDDDHVFMVKLAAALGWHLPVDADPVRWRHEE